MNVLILTQPLLNNYGCLLQNFALQHVLQNLGCNCLTYDIVLPIRFGCYILSCLKSLFLFLIPGKRRRFVKFVMPPRRKKFSRDFVASNLVSTKMYTKYLSKILYKNQIDAVIVGSDQVWRPKYSYRIKDKFLDFCKKKKDLKRIAYAASFGVDSWEYSLKQTLACSRLAQKFDAISVREESGVKLCNEHFGVYATWVLDPTLLLTRDDYLLICKDIPSSSEKYLAVYVLDENEQVTKTYEKVAENLGLVIKKFHADSKSTLTVPEWLAMFRDASYVVTDSFHGTVFSIIFGKEFKCIYNEGRGSARFESLLNLYNSGKLDEMREFSLNWLKNALEK